MKEALENFLVLCQELSREKISLVSSAGTGNRNTSSSNFGALEPGRACAAAEHLGGLPGLPVM